MPAENARQFLFHPENAEPNGVVRLVLGQNVDIAVRAEVITQHRAEQGKLADVMSPARVSHLVGRDVDSRFLYHVCFFEELSVLSTQLSVLSCQYLVVIVFFLASPRAPFFAAGA